MALKKSIKVKLDSQVILRKMLALMSLLAFFVVTIASLKAGVDLYWATVRAAVVMVGFKIISVVVLQMLTTYEEMNSGEK